MTRDPVSTTYDSVRRAYDEVAEDYARFLPDTRAEAPIDLTVVDAFIGAVGPGARVLDAGCGAGRMSRYLASRQLLVEGIDLSSGMVAMAHRNNPDLTFAVGSIDEIPFEDASFDGVLLWYSTIHTPPQGQSRLYQEVARVLRTAGNVLVAFQTGTGVHDVSANYARYGHEIDLVRYRFTPDEVAAWLATAGLQETCRVVRGPRGRELDGQSMLIARA